MDQRFDPARVEAVISEIGADIIALQEADQRFGGRSGLLDLARLERRKRSSSGSGERPSEMPRMHGQCSLFREGTVSHVHQVTLPGIEPRAHWWWMWI